ncbi:hypothetical protein MJO29_005464 [Puccinia striiformis f. sp. tritici]|nr:hypothetical protein MJO29_005464 [Puccinia striiformis f. sp. tritici]
MLLVCMLAAVGLMQHEAKGSVLHSRNVAELRGQDNTCAAGMTRYCNILRRTNGTLQKLWQEVVPPRKDGTIPTEADCEKLNEQEKKDQAGDLKQKWKLSGCCDATKFDKSVSLNLLHKHYLFSYQVYKSISLKYLAPN